jgi:radical SAM superfamily enzyme YgiQ (UPF0313 family)
MPITLAYTAATIREAGYAVKVIDAFAEKPYQSNRDGKFLFLGLPYKEILSRISQDVEAVFIFAINLTNHKSCAGIVQAVKREYPELPVIVLENTQAVTAYALAQVAHEFFQIGADYIITGESEQRSLRLLKALTTSGNKDLIGQIDGIGTPSSYVEPNGFIPSDELDKMPYPAWDLFPLENYWKLRFAHGPQESKRYLPLLTSRGCPYPCRFCVVPSTNKQKWRPYSAKRVVDEIEYYTKRFNVKEFHIEDLNPTISDKRVREICEEILNRKLDITWKLAAGTKVESIRSEETIDLMAKAGCSYISVSPETGSPQVLRNMRKPFDLEHAVRLVNRMNQVHIRSQACFVLGFPGEDDDDRQMTREMVHDLTRKGVDEIALFIITPVPGSSIYEDFQGYQNLSELNFSPTWRKDYKKLSQFRLRLYASFLFWKIRYHPAKIIRQAINFLLRRFETKMEMVPYRALILHWLGYRAGRYVDEF